ncbi:MAG: hypothetical protein AAFY99_11210 [Pseudomonadota bacterium]
MRFLFRVLLLLVAASGAIAFGALSAERVTRSFHGFVPIDTGTWRAYPGLATSAADPYARAHLARSGKLPIADTEGIEFTATRDTQGDLLRAACDYYVVGNLPANRLWTFRVAPIDSAATRDVWNETVANSRLHARTGQNDVSLYVGQTPAGINWYPLDASDVQAVMFIMTFYDSAVATTASFTDLEMPVIERLRCADG